MNHIKSIAAGVRKWAEKLSRNSGKHGRADLCGFCAIASAQLFDRLKDHDYEPEIHYSECEQGGHVFVTVDDHVVDVTATQFEEFSRTPVVVLHCKEAEIYEHWIPLHTFKSVEELIDFQVKDGWPKHQCVAVAA